jgi:hypothetical protein
MNTRRTPAEGDRRQCPQCHDTLVFTPRHPILAAGMIRAGTETKPADRIRHEPAWVCRNGGCDYREFVGA